MNLSGQYVIHIFLNLLEMLGFRNAPEYKTSFISSNYCVAIPPGRDKERREFPPKIAIASDSNNHSKLTLELWIV